MKLKIEEVINNSLGLDEYKIIVEHNKNSEGSEHYLKYIKEYSINQQRIFVENNGEYEYIFMKDVLYFYSNGRYNYAKTINQKYRVKSKLYELESDMFIRVSKHCIINISHISSFDLSRTGQIIANIDNGEQEIVSRRCVRNVLYCLDERGV